MKPRAVLAKLGVEVEVAYPGCCGIAAGAWRYRRRREIRREGIGRILEVDREGL